MADGHMTLTENACRCEMADASAENSTVIFTFKLADVMEESVALEIHQSQRLRSSSANDVSSRCFGAKSFLVHQHHPTTNSCRFSPPPLPEARRGEARLVKQTVSPPQLTDVNGI